MLRVFFTLLLVVSTVADMPEIVEAECWLQDLVGPELVGPRGGALTPTCAVSFSLSALVFASGSCEACVAFATQLDQLAASGNVALVLASRDKSKERFLRHTALSPAWAIPFSSAHREAVNDKFQRPPVPTVIVYGADGLELDRQGYFTVRYLGSVDAALKYWTGLITGDSTPVDHRYLSEMKNRNTEGATMQKLVPANAKE